MLAPRRWLPEPRLARRIVLLALLAWAGTHFGRRAYWHIDDGPRRALRVTVTQEECVPRPADPGTGLVVGNVVLPLTGFTLVKREGDVALATDGTVKYRIHAEDATEIADIATLRALQVPPPSLAQYLWLPPETLMKHRRTIAAGAVLGVVYPEGVRSIECQGRRIVVGVRTESVVASMRSDLENTGLCIVQQRAEINDHLEEAIDELVRILAQCRPVARTVPVPSEGHGPTD